MPQTLIFDLLERAVDPAPEMPPHNGSDTSKAAAESIRHQVRADAAIVLATIRAAGDRGRTCDEVEAITGLTHQAASARINGLAGDGHIIEARDAAGEIVKRPTRGGRKAVCRIASTPEGDRS